MNVSDVLDLIDKNGLKEITDYVRTEYPQTLYQEVDVNGAPYSMW